MRPSKRPPSGPDRLSAESELVPSVENQTLGGREQTASDADQTASDADQVASEEDELSSARDQDTSDREQAAAGSWVDARDPEAFARNRAAREATTRDRDVSSQRREEAAVDRGRSARARDGTARARDQAAHLRDRMADERDRDARAQDGWSQSFWGESPIPAALREQAARDRARAAADRERAAQDRKRAARDREEAARHRREAARERAQAARDRELAAGDPLTGTRARGPGLADLQREIDRARRTTASLVLAFVDVDGLKQVNDTQGHLAGDRLLAEVASALRGGLRSYDLIMRVGGDEFLCALSGIATDEVKRRFGQLATGLAFRSDGHSISVGFAALEDGDDTQALIQRADHALLRARQGR